MSGEMTEPPPPGGLVLIDRIFYGFTSFLNVLAAIWLSAIALLILCDVLGREFFSSPIYGTNEIVANSVLSILLLQLPLSVMTRRQLRTTIVYGSMSIRNKSYIDAASYFFGACLFLSIAIGGWAFMIESWEIGELEGSGIVSIPVYPIRSLVVIIGFVGMLVCLLQVWKALADPTDFVDE